MTFVTLSNAIMMLLCIAVIVQTLRMAKSIREIRSAALGDAVAQLDRATGRAQAVLGELKAMLASDIVAQNRAMSDGEALRDELSVMVGIGNSVAERIMEAVAAQKELQAAPPKSEASVRRVASRKTRSRAAGGRRKESAASVLSAAVTGPVAGHA